MKSDIRKQVEQFMQAADQPVQQKPTIPLESRTRLRLQLVLEETLELVNACIPGFSNCLEKECFSLVKGVAELPTNPDIEGVADSLADIDYVVEGMRLEFGINGFDIAEEVHQANMRKFGFGSYIREDGKRMKPPGWVGPDILGVLKKQGLEVGETLNKKEIKKLLVLDKPSLQKVQNLVLFAMDDSNWLDLDDVCMQPEKPEYHLNINDFFLTFYINRTTLSKCLHISINERGLYPHTNEITKISKLFGFAPLNYPQVRLQISELHDSVVVCQPWLINVDLAQGDD